MWLDLKVLSVSLLIVGAFTVTTTPSSMVEVLQQVSRRFEISSRDSGEQKLVRTLAIYKLTFVASLLFLLSDPMVLLSF